MALLLAMAVQGMVDKMKSSGVLLRIAAVIASLLLLEGAIRLFHLSPVNDYRPLLERDRRYPMRPHASMVEIQPDFKNPIRINGAGFRDKPFALEKKPGVTRIAVLGDSFTFGTGVPEGARTTDYLEILLRQHGKSCEVYNFALPDAETVEENAVLRDCVLPYRPDHALLMFYVGNDVVNNLKLSHGQPKGNVHRNPLYWLVDQIRLHSHTYQLMMMRAASLPGVRRWYNRIKTKNLWGEAGEQLRIFQVASAPDQDKALWKPTFDALEDFVRVCRDHGIRPGVVLLPAKLQYDEPLWNEMLRAQKLSAAEFSVQRPNQVIAEFLRQNLGVEVWDPLPVFQATLRQGADLYYPTNGHWKASGHRLCAEYLAERLQKGLVDIPVLGLNTRPS